MRANDAEIRIAVTGKMPSIADLADAFSRNGWKMTEVKSVENLPVVIEETACQAAIVATNNPENLPLATIRSLMGMQADVTIMFLVPDPEAVVKLPTFAGTVSSQIQPLLMPPESLIKILKNEFRANSLLPKENWKIICVDDDNEFLSSLEQLLPGHLEDMLPQVSLDFEFFTSSEKALAAIKAVEPSALAMVICDQVMPQMKGLELLRQIKEYSSDVIRVLMTGYAGLDSAIVAINERLLDQYFTKPVDRPADFINAIRQLLQRRHIQKTRDADRRRLMLQFELLHALSIATTEKAVYDLLLRLFRHDLFIDQAAIISLEGEQHCLRASLSTPPGMKANQRFSASQGLGDWLRQLRGTTLAIEQSDFPEENNPFWPNTYPFMAIPLRWGNARFGTLLTAGPAIATRENRLLAAFAADIASVTLIQMRDHELLERHYIDTITSLMEVMEAKDLYTRGHTDRVRTIATTLIRATGASEKEIKDVDYAACLHDIDKIAVPDSIISKPARLTRQEYQVIQQHPSRGEKILQHLHFLDHARMIIRSHHERYDGKGYPDGLAGEEIPLGARVLAIADSFDAMISDRPYRSALTIDQVLAELEAGAGSQFDPRLVQLFTRMVQAEREKDPSEQLILSGRD